MKKGISVVMTKKAVALVNRNGLWENMIDLSGTSSSKFLFISDERFNASELTAHGVGSTYTECRARIAGQHVNLLYVDPRASSKVDHDKNCAVIDLTTKQEPALVTGVDILKNCVNNSGASNSVVGYCRASAAITLMQINYTRRAANNSDHIADIFTAFVIAMLHPTKQLATPLSVGGYVASVALDNTSNKNPALIDSVIREFGYENFYADRGKIFENKDSWLKMPDVEVAVAEALVQSGVATKLYYERPQALTLPESRKNAPLTKLALTKHGRAMLEAFSPKPH